jgi:Xaa-Pro aminopeptidase
MFQDFDVKGGPEFGRRNLPRLREELSRRGLDGFIVPHEDEYQNEYLPECAERLAYVTGFTGSAGAAVILLDRAVIFTDGRYHLQVRSQTDPELFIYEDLTGDGVAKYLHHAAPNGAQIGYDPRLHSPDTVERLEKAAAKAGAHLLPVMDNPVDAIWQDRPAPPAAPIVPHAIEHAGEAHGEKRHRIAMLTAEAGADYALITAPASVAWLLNVRGGDVSHSPLPLSAVLLRPNGSADLFAAPEKVGEALHAHLGNEVAVRDERDLEPVLAELKGESVLVDPKTASAWHFGLLQAAGATIVRGDDPAALPRACKNEAEIEGSKAAHRRDGAALSAFLHWFSIEAPKGGLDEIEAAKRLEEFRAATGALRDLSFDTISGAGPNGAVVHYRASTETSRAIEPGSLFLVDSGGQYLDGTTDVTRTVAVGAPSAEMIRRFTLVLKGHIALAIIRFPEDTPGGALDVLARQALWAEGLDYDHGTGHGVGAYLGVHEGPQRIGKRGGDAPLRTGMIVSNEPGYYKNGEYGIRIENLQFVTQPQIPPGGERAMLGFETLTLAPVDRALIEPALLSEAERAWLNAYHSRVLAEIGPLLEPDARAWLQGACAPL